MKLEDALSSVLKGEQISHKLVDFESVELGKCNLRLPSKPARSSRIGFSNKRKKFPKDLREKTNRAYALHCFANHELLAIEIMAHALIRCQEAFKDVAELRRFQAAIVSTIRDEQTHFSLYQKRIQDLGFEFGDFPLNDFFWSYAQKISTPSEYFSLMAMTFEAANLDFAAYYRDVFFSIDDQESGAIMSTVFQDELSHVRVGARFLSKWRGDQSLWNYYLANLIAPLSADRSKGIHFNVAWRKKAGLSESFCQSLSDYDSQFAVTQRRK